MTKDARTLSHGAPLKQYIYWQQTDIASFFITKGFDFQSQKNHLFIFILGFSHTYGYS